MRNYGKLSNILCLVIGILEIVLGIIFGRISIFLDSYIDNSYNDILLLIVLFLSLGIAIIIFIGAVVFGIAHLVVGILKL